ncbi:hypothetical protein [Paenibacillus graminis]|uniref:hypothetical protein n=1 Tax=Paenibacillus graminis TaxID=189425 RepID=UPI000FB49C1B|nr:hypothetical protein [Paenibacillus graminis]MEC0167244.1 hypothetical protein [Paenibacillus graminis]
MKVAYKKAVSEGATGAALEEVTICTVKLLKIGVEFVLTALCAVEILEFPLFGAMGTV